MCIRDRDSRDLDGRVDWEKGVVGEMSVEPSIELLPKVVARAGREASSFEGLAGAWFLDETAMYWSTHFEMMVSSNSLGASSLNRGPAARAKVILSL